MALGAVVFSFFSRVYLQTFIYLCTSRSSAFMTRRWKGTCFFLSLHVSYGWSRIRIAEMRWEIKRSFGMMRNSLRTWYQVGRLVENVIYLLLATGQFHYSFSRIKFSSFSFPFSTLRHFYTTTNGPSFPTTYMWISKHHAHSFWLQIWERNKKLMRRTSFAWILMSPHRHFAFHLISFSLYQPS